MRSRTRVRLCWTPIWEGSVKGWAIKFIHTNKWRCDKIHEFDDLLQDAYLTFVKISEKYPRVSQPQHFMALFKSAVWNQMHDRARYMRRKRLIHEETNDDPMDLLGGTDHNAGPLLLSLAEAPEELRQAIILMETEPDLIRGEHTIRENLNGKLRRILGLEEQFDFTAMLKNLLTN